MYRIWNLANKIYDVYIKNLYLFLLIFLLNYLTVFVYILLFEEKSVWLTKLILSGVNIFFISSLTIFPLNFLSAKIGKVYKIACLLFLMILFGSEVFMLYTFKTLLLPSSILILFQTNKNELTEFLTVYITNRSIGVVMASMLSVVCVLWMLRKIDLRGILLHKKIKLVFSKIICLGLFFGLMITVYSQYRVTQMIVSFRLITPTQRLFYSSLVSYMDMRHYRQVQMQIRGENILVHHDTASIQNVVLILGESLGRNHMSLYDYHLKTTPLLDSLQEAGELFVFRDVVTSGTTTIESLKNIFTFYNTESVDEWYNYPILMDIMERAGYNTTWISNQESFGVWGNLPAVMAGRSNQVLFNKIRNSKEENYGTFDEQLIPIISKVLLEKGVEKNFIVIHLMGSHTHYKNRYPESFKHFTSQDIKTDRCPGIVAEYDNSVLYNDYVIDEIINLFRTEEAVIFYLSDHGEEVYDYRDFIGHSPTNISRYMVEIPFIAWMSASCKARYTDKVEKISSSLDRSYMSDDMIHTLLDLTGIVVPQYDSTRSVINDKFDNRRARNINRTMNYDSKLKNNN